MVNEYAGAATAAAALHDYTPAAGSGCIGVTEPLTYDFKINLRSLCSPRVCLPGARNAPAFLSLSKQCFFFLFFFHPPHRPAACQIAHVNAPLSSLLSLYSPLSRSRRFSYLRSNDRPVVSLRRDIYPNEERVKSCRTSQPADCANHEGISQVH